MSVSTLHHTLRAIREFLGWLQGQEAFRRKIKLPDIAYLNLTTGDERRARTTAPKPYPSLDDFRAALFAMPSASEVERRDRAIMACLLLTAMRDTALIGLKLRDVDLSRAYIFQDPRHARTKFSKPIDTYFYPVGDDVTAIFTGWLNELTQTKGFGPHDPMFPKTIVRPDADQEFAAQGISRQHWANAAPVRKCFKAAFARIGLPFSKPHSVRDTITQLGYRLKLDAEQMKAWSLNMGHDKPLTTFNNYGQLTRERQGEIILGLARQKPTPEPATSSEERIAELVAAKIMARQA